MKQQHYEALPNGCLFRFAEDEIVKRGPWMPPKVIARPQGVFVKEGNSHARRVQSGMEAVTVIPHLKQACLLIRDQMPGN